MTENELRIEHKYRYEERLGIMGQFGIPTTFEHNTAVEEADAAIKELRKGDSLAERLRQFRLSL